MLKEVNFSFELVILLFQIADEKGGLLWDKRIVTGHGIELLVEFVKLKTLLFVKGLVVSHSGRVKDCNFFLLIIFLFNIFINSNLLIDFPSSYRIFNEVDF